MINEHLFWYRGETVFLFLQEAKNAVNLLMRIVLELCGCTSLGHFSTPPALY